MRPHTQTNYESNPNCSKPNRQPHLQTRVPRPEVKGRRKARRGRGSNRTIRTEDSLRIEVSIERCLCAGQAQAEGHWHSKMYSDIYLPLNALATTCMAVYNPHQARVEARRYSVNRFRCDNDRGEYDNKNFRTILAGAGTTYEPCPPYAHHKNGVAERIIGVITEKARAMMIDAQAPNEFWGEAVNTANYLLRMTPNNGLVKRDDRNGYKASYDTPHEMLHAYGKPKRDAEGKDISYKAPTHYLRRFGCHASKLIPEAQRSSKFGPKSKLGCMMVGYVHDSTTTWRIWNPEFEKANTQSDVIFDEERNAYIACPPPPTNEKVCDGYTRPPTRGNTCGRA